MSNIINGTAGNDVIHGDGTTGSGEAFSKSVGSTSNSGNSANFSDLWENVTVEGRLVVKNDSGFSLSDPAFNNLIVSSNGIGVKGVTSSSNTNPNSGLNKQIGYNAEAKMSEELIVSFNADENVTSAVVGIQSLFANEGERGRWAALKDGVEVGSGEISFEKGKNSGEVSINVSTGFDKILFAALPYTNQKDNTKDSSDFYVKYINFEGTYVVDDGTSDNDIIAPGAGADMVDGEDGIDTVDYSAAKGTVLADLSEEIAIKDGDGYIDSLKNIENITGSNQSDILIGNDGNNVLEGGAGDDFLQGKSGSNTLKGGDGVDTAVFAGDESVNANLMNGRAIKASGKDTLESIENIIGSSKNDTIKGDNGDNVIIGGYGDDKITVSDGNNIIIGDNASLSIDQPNHLIVNAHGSPLNGAFPVMEVKVGGIVVGKVTVDASNKPYAFDLSALSDTQKSGEVVVRLVNDAWDGVAENSFGVDGAEDRNLFVENIEYNGFTTPSSEGTLSHKPSTFQGYQSGGKEADVDNIFTETRDGTFKGGNIYNGTVTFSSLPDGTFGAFGVENSFFDGNDRITTGDGNDRVYSQGGDDRISTKGGDDLVVSESGNNRVNTGDGNDRVYLGKGNDRVNLGNGDDVAYTGDGNDRIRGNDGDDMLYGEAGDDNISGGHGNDKIYGGDGNDIINSGAGNDEVYGGDGNDRIRGNDGDDVLHGEGGDDNISGGHGNDKIYGGDGKDTLSGGHGKDILEGGDGNDTLRGGDDNDTLFLGSGDDIAHGDSGDDIIYGGSGNNKIYGGSGNDTIYTEDSQTSVVRAGKGDDTIYAGTGSDLIRGDAGNDTIVFDSRVFEITNGTARTFDPKVLYDGGDSTEYANFIDSGKGALLSSGHDIVHGGSGMDTIELRGEGWTVDITHGQFSNSSSSLWEVNGLGSIKGTITNSLTDAKIDFNGVEKIIIE
jgi:Ca2+-binding RTX toxin-like protein